MSALEDKTRPRFLLGLLAALAPVLSPIGFGVLLEWGPKSPIDGACGSTELVGVLSILLGALPPLLAVGWAVARRKQVELVFLVFLAALFTTGVGFFIAWLIVFSANNCGE